MPISKLGQRGQVVIPKAMCKELGLQEGDLVEVTSYQDGVMIKSKKLVDADEVPTPEQKTIIDVRLTKALEDSEHGRVHGWFDSVDAMLSSLHGASRARKAK